MYFPDVFDLQACKHLIANVFRVTTQNKSFNGYRKQIDIFFSFSLNVLFKYTRILIILNIKRNRSYRIMMNWNY